MTKTAKTKTAKTTRNTKSSEIARLTAELNTMRKENFRLWTHLEEATSDRDTNNEAYEARTEQVNRLKQERNKAIQERDEARAEVCHLRSGWWYRVWSWMA